MAHLAQLLGTSPEAGLGLYVARSRSVVIVVWKGLGFAPTGGPKAAPEGLLGPSFKAGLRYAAMGISDAAWWRAAREAKRFTSREDFAQEVISRPEAGSNI